MTRTFTVTLRRNSVQPSTGLWYLKSRLEAGEWENLTVGNFSAVTLPAAPNGWGGQSYWVKLGPAEISWIQQINASSYKSWEWASSPADGTIYTQWDGVTCRWPRIALHSPDNCELSQRNQVRVLEYSGEYCRIASIPKGGGDYTMFTEPWLIHTAYLIRPDNYTNDNPYYKMPLWNPDSGFEVSAGERGLWLHTKWLYSRV